MMVSIERHCSNTCRKEWADVLGRLEIYQVDCTKYTEWFLKYINYQLELKIKNPILKVIFHKT